MIYLTVEDVLREHVRLIGADLVREHGQVAATVARPQSGFGNEEFYPSLAGKAAALLHGFATTQAFVDGNKRMAVYTATTFCLINGYRCTLDDQQIYEMTMGAAEGLLQVEKITEVLESSLMPLLPEGFNI